MKYLYLFVCALSPFVVGAQSEAKLERARGYVQTAERYYEEAKYDKSIKEYQFAATIYRELQHFDKYAICYNGVGNNYINLTRYEEAYAEFRRVMSNFDEIKQKKADFLPDSMLIADAYEGFGRFYYSSGARYDSALLWHMRALDIRKRSVGEQHPKTALSYYFIGMAYRGIKLDSLQMGQGANPIMLELEFLEKARMIQEGLARRDTLPSAALADTYQALGDYYYDVLQDYLHGSDWHEKALKIRQKRFSEAHPNTALSYLNIAKYNRLISEYETEREYLERALRLQEAVFGIDHRDVALTLAALANRYRTSGDVERGLSYFQRAEKILIDRTGAQSAELANVYLGIAQCYGDLDNHYEQRDYLRRVLYMWQSIYGATHQQMGVAYSEMGDYYVRRNTLDSALFYYEKATDLWIKQLGSTHIWVAESYERLARVYALRGDGEREYFYLESALNLKKSTAQISGASGELADEFQQAKRASPQQLYESYLKMAQFYQRKKDYPLALSFCQGALSALFPSIAKQGGNLYANPSIAELSRNIVWLDALQLKGKLLLQDYVEGKHENKDLRFAVETYTHAMRLIDTLRINFTTDGAREQLTRRSIPIYEGALQAQYLLYEIDKKAENLQAAFAIMERSKAFVMMQALQTSQARSAGIIPDELLAKEELLRQNLSYYSDAKNRKKSNAANFDKAYFETKRAYDSLITYLETNYPKYYQLKYAQPTIKITDIQQKLLRPNDLLIEYFVGDEYIYVFCIQTEKVSVQQLRIEQSKMHNLNILRNHLTNYSYVVEKPAEAFSNFCETSHEVYKLFLAPYMKGISPESTERLIIIPDGLLSYVPFEVFLQEEVAKDHPPTYRNLPFLLRDYEIVYSYSSGLMLQNVQSVRARHNGRCLGFAPAYLHEHPATDHKDLPWAAKELESIKEVFKGDYLIGGGATKAAFQQQAPQYAVIHLAMHGIVDWHNSQKSHLAFASIKGDTTGDASNLYNFEIQNIPLRADLVVLSACETGYGKMIRGEGVLSLARGFMLAGTPSVLTTLWQVNDFTTSTLMTLFYANLQQGMPKSAALRRAKLDYLAHSDQVSGHPAFWASVVLMGDPAPVRSAWGWLAWTVIALSSGTLFLGAFWMLRRRRERRLLQAATDAAMLNRHKEENPQEAAEMDKLLALIRQRSSQKAQKGRTEKG